MSPQVSIIIPTFNRRQYLAEAIQSVLTQTVNDLELIVVDDGSTDDTPGLVRQFDHDPRVRYVHQPNQGRSRARNHGAALARGEFLGFLDSDDRYAPTAAEMHLHAFAECGGAGMVIGGYQVVDDVGKLLAERRPWDSGGGLGLNGWLFNCYAMPGSVMLRRAWFEQCRGFDSETEIAEDWDLFLRLAHIGCQMAWTRHLVCYYRQHAGGSIHGIDKHQRGSLRALDNLFTQSDLAPDVAKLQDQAKAWVYVLFAKKYFTAGQLTEADHNMQRAIQLDPELIHSRKAQLVEFLVAPSVGHEVDSTTMDDLLAGSLSLPLSLSASDIRRARARAEMAQFFQLAQHGSRTRAAQHLQAGLRLDPYWLANRGVLSFCIKQALRRFS